jgi:hypothetical protein
VTWIARIDCDCGLRFFHDHVEAFPHLANEDLQVEVGPAKHQGKICEKNGHKKCKKQIN